MSPEIFKKENKPVLFLAPMEGITNSIFRKEIVDLGGVDVVATEFIRITGERQKIPEFNRYQVPLQVQVMGTTPQVISNCMKFLKIRSTLQDSDWIDLNVGCPSKRVTCSGAGSALLLDPKKLVAIIQAMRGVHSGTLSIKTRLGFQSSENFTEILEVLKDCPLDFLTVHARSQAGKYEEKVNYDFFNDAVRILPYPVIGNGDISSVEIAKRVLETGVSGIMCGRPAITNPFLFNELKSYFQKQEEFVVTKEMLLDFAKRLLQAYLAKEQVSKKKFIGVYKEFSIWFSKNDLVGREFFDRIKRTTSLQEVMAVLEF